MIFGIAPSNHSYPLTGDIAVKPFMARCVLDRNLSSGPIWVYDPIENNFALLKVTS